VWLSEDSVLVKEPGSEEKTAWHQDMAYFALTNDNAATTWVPLDPVTATTGAVRYVAGSHRDRTKFRPGTFVTDVARSPRATRATAPHTRPRPAWRSPPRVHGRGAPLDPDACPLAWPPAGSASSS